MDSEYSSIDLLQQSSSELTGNTATLVNHLHYISLRGHGSSSLGKKFLAIAAHATRCALY